MKKIINLITMILLIGLVFGCSMNKDNQQNDQNNSEQTITDGTTTPTIDEGYKVTFITNEFVTVTIYDTQEMVNGTVTNDTVSKDSSTGNPSSTGDGQVNFSLEIVEGYELSSISVEGTYKNIKYPFETQVEGLYRITKIASDLKVTIETIEADTPEDLENAFKVNFVLDENITTVIYKTQELTNGEYSIVGYARDGSSGALLNDGNGQINFLLQLKSGFEVDQIEITGEYKNLKTPADTGVSNTYRITKIASDLTVTITSKERETESEYVVNTTDGENNYSLTLTALTGSFYVEEKEGVVNVEIFETSEITLTGSLYGSLNITGSEDFELTIDLNGVEIVSYNTLPCIYADAFSSIDISAKKGTVNNILDKREAQEELSSAIYITCDLKLKGSGTLNVTSLNNNGIHTKDDLEVQKLTLNVSCIDNALKGNDSITINSGNLTLIARQGDALKTSNSDVSSKGNQRGTITILDGTLNLFAATDGIDASYNCIIGSDTTSPTINIYTDKYSEYSEEITAIQDSIYYIRNNTTSYKYSILYYNDASDYLWVNSTTYKTVQAGRNTYYYYEMSKPAGYEKMNVFVYSSNQSQAQSETYYATTGLVSVNDNYDTIAYNNSRFSWTNYTTQGGMGPGGMQEGNSDKGDYSTKGIKADNEIIINNGNITIKAYDDAIHANNDVVLENNETPLGNITINNGVLNLYSNDDAIHGDGVVTINNGTINISYCYEGVEGNTVVVNGGNISLYAKDDGINSKATSGTGITLKGGYIYIYSSGDGIDSNSRTSYAGIDFCGSNVIIISTSGGNSCIDTDAGYKYSSGIVIGICPTGMQNESIRCSNFNSIGKSTTLSLTKNNYVTISNFVTIKMPTSISNGFVVALTGTSSVTISQSSSFSGTLDNNGVYFN